MGKKDDYMRGRADGLNYALQIAEKKGLEGLREECRFRNATGIPQMIPRDDVLAACEKYERIVKECTCDTIASMTMIALVDAFGFGKKRLERFRDMFEHYTDSLVGGWIEWPDIVEALKEEKGIDMHIRWNGGAPK